MAADGATRRETEVLALVGDHLSNIEIAERLHLSVRTVENHVASLLRKFGVADRRALARIAGPAAEGTYERARVTGLPAMLTRFIGREEERGALADALGEGRLVTLQGPGGVGKTRLATEVAADVEPCFPDGGAFVDLLPVRHGYVAQAVASALRVEEKAQQSLADAIADRLGESRILLILDNCEHIVDAAAAFVERLLIACPGTRVLATSRERLGIRGERVVQLAPLPLGSDAEALFLDRAAAAGFDVTGLAADASGAAVVSEICRRVDGIPLAIELAAARATGLGAQAVLAGLDDSLGFLAGGRGVDERHRSLRAVVGWSYTLLDEEERRLFRS